MSYNSLPSAWDFALPPPLPEISDDQFLTLLNQQFESTNKDLLAPLTANPQALTRFPLNLNVTPSNSEDSSPSPPGSSNDTANGNDSSRRQPSTSRQPTRSTSSTTLVDDAKRKASFDDYDPEFDGPPNAKNFHADNESKKAPSRRKSSGGGGPGQKDESRLMKRKEQNRAAQRAFRERKEKHVRDLEDKVAMLEAKSEFQAVENNNLRDLLSRLQAENLNLRQASNMGNYNYNNSAGPSKDALSPSSSSVLDMQSLGRMASPSQASSTAASPPSNRAPEARPMQSPPGPYFTSSPYLNLDAISSQSTSQAPDLSSLGVPPPFTLPVNSPYTQIAANPLFMSFADNAFSPYSSFAQSIEGSTPSTSGGHVESAPLSAPELALSPRSFNELFGGQLETLIPFSGDMSLFDFNTPASSVLSPVDSSNQVRTASTSQQTTPMEVFSKAQAGPASGAHTDGNCPKSSKDLADRMAGSQPSTFGPPVAAAFSESSTPDMVSSSSSLDVNVTMSEAGEKVDPCTPESTKVCTVPSDKNILLTTAWEHVSKHPRFQDFDMDELCQLLTSKAKCDGTNRVIEPDDINAIMDELPNLSKNNTFPKTTPTSN